jgi:putative heme-binding domain-containing protein
MRLACIASVGLAVMLWIDLSSTSSQGSEDLPSDLVARTQPKTAAEEQKCFHLPPGFTIELVAAEPDIIKPINMNFDDRGRLWVTQSVEYPFSAPSDRKARDTVKVLGHWQADGRAASITTFADGLNIPIGVLPVAKGAIVYSIPNVYRMLDIDGDGRADRRELLYGSIGYVDTHGMTSAFTWGFDGWVYACHGFANHSTLKARDGSVIQLISGNTYRMKPDGSHVEQFTHGQVNPFGLTFDPLGNLWSADCHTQPVMMLLRGGYYHSFGKPHDGLGFAPEVCDHDHGSTAISGIVYYAADQFPPEFHDNLFVGNVVTNRINRDRLERHGSTLKAIEQPDFLRCDDPWFRPVDLKLGPDGAMYVADFYNRIIGHYEVPLMHPGRDHERGRIWRIVYRGEGRKATPARSDWEAATVAELVEDLSHPNLVVRMKATNQLVERGSQDVIESAGRTLSESKNAHARRHALWVLERLQSLDDSRLIAAAQDADNGVRAHAMRALAERRELSSAAYKLARSGLQDADPFVQRAAADALGQHAAIENLRPLLHLLEDVPQEDTQLLHTVRMALRNQLRSDGTWQPALASAAWSARDLRAFADVALGVPNAEAAGFLLRQLQLEQIETARLLDSVHHVARYGREAAVQSVLSFARGHHPEDVRHQAALFRALLQGTQERGGKLPAEARTWAEPLAAQLLSSAEVASVMVGIDLAGSLQVKALQQPLAALAVNKALAEKERRAALDALVAIDAKGQAAFLGRMLEDAAEAMPLRERAAEMLVGVNQPEASGELVKTLAVAPAQLQSVIAYALVTTQPGAERLLDAVTAGKASARLLKDRRVEVRLDRYASLRARVAGLTQGLPSADERLQKLLQQRRQAFAKARIDTALGAKVFEKSCAICHQLGGRGAKVGPQLDGIGIRGLDRLLEDIIDPNRNVDQAFRSTLLTLKNGQYVSGLVLREEGEVVVVADAQGKDVRVPKSTIDERTVSQISPMPANLVDQIPEADFYNLLAYLLAQRPPSGARTEK